MNDMINGNLVASWGEVMTGMNKSNVSSTTILDCNSNQRSERESKRNEREVNETSENGSKLNE